MAENAIFQAQTAYTRSATTMLSMPVNMRCRSISFCQFSCTNSSPTSQCSNSN